MASVVSFGRIGRGLLPLILVGVIAGCGSGEEASAPPSSSLPPAATTTTFPATAEQVSLELDSLGSIDTAAIIAGFLPEITEDDIEVIGGESGTSYRYVFPTRDLADGVSVDLVALWSPVNGGLQPSVEWTLTGDESSPSEIAFFASIPKLFGETVDEMTFDPQPAEIIDADVVARWDVQLSTHATVHALSSRMVAADDPSDIMMMIVDHVNTQRAHAELTACYAPFRRTDAIAQCYLAVVAQNAQSFNERSCDAIGRMVYSLAATTSHDSVVPGISSACKSVLQLASTGTRGGCESITGSDVSGDYWNCFHWVSRLLLGACPLDGSLEGQICAYESAVALNATRGCDWIEHLGNTEMANDCRATLTRDPSYCAITDDAALRASCCETFRGTDDYDTCIGDSQSVTTTTSESSTTTTSDVTTTTVTDDTTTTEAGDEEGPPAIPAGVYTGSFDEQILVDVIAFDFGKPDTNTMTVTIDEEGLISGDLAVHQEGLFMSCTGAESDWTGTIDSGQIIGPTLPHTVAVTFHVMEADPFDAGTWNNAQCVWPPVVTTEQSSLPLTFETIQDGLLTGLAGDYVPFELQLVP